MDLMFHQFDQICACSISSTSMWGVFSSEYLEDSGSTGFLFRGVGGDDFFSDELSLSGYNFLLLFRSLACPLPAGVPYIPSRDVLVRRGASWLGSLRCAIAEHGWKVKTQMTIDLGQCSIHKNSGAWVLPNCSIFSACRLVLHLIIRSSGLRRRSPWGDQEGLGHLSFRLTLYWFDTIGPSKNITPSPQFLLREPTSSPNDSLHLRRATLWNMHTI